MQLTLPDLASARVLVAGDVMLDRYWHGGTGRISPEAPVPVVRVGDEEARPGGAANVAMNVRALGAAATLVGLIGDDDNGRLLTAGLEGAGVGCDLATVPGHPTICKLRVLSRRQQLIRLDFERGFTATETVGLPGRFRAALQSAGVVILSDYAKGTLSDVPALIAEARGAGLPVLVDPKGTDWSRYRGATALTPNLAELEAVAGPCPDNAALQERAGETLAALELQALLVTRGEQGMSLFRAGEPPLHLPAHAREVYDVTGAGDTVISVLATALAAGAGLEAATALANLAAGLVVAKVGTASVSVAELEAALGPASVGERGAVDRRELAVLVAAARARGERVVMTNGCFDLLHAGHVAYLGEARALGDRLAVAVNDDASVRRLKGAGRPVTPLSQRLAVLAGLAAVDWVVPFAEDTPAALIGEVLPDVLVKGGDYRAEDIAGADAVRRNGGEVRVLGFIEGESTSALIERIRRQGQGAAGE